MQKDNATTLFVSQNCGNDSNEGLSVEAPLAGIERALDIVKTLREDGHQQPISIQITDDEYIMREPVVIDASMSAVTIEPYTKTKISGGFRIENFKKDIFNGVNCVSAELPGVKEGSLRFTDLYVNGVAAEYTHYPDEGFLYAKDVENHGTKLSDHSKWFIAEDKDMSVIKNFRNLRDCFISFNHHWIDEHTPIKDYDAKTGKIEFAYASRFTLDPTREAAKLRYRIENIAETFKNPGEWYLDCQNGKVYYILRENENIENIIAYAPLTSKLFILNGDKDNRIERVHLRGFDFNCTKGDYSSKYVETDAAHDIYKFDENFEGYAADIQSVCWGHGSVEMKYARNCSIKECLFLNMGVHAINIAEGCENIYIERNEIMETGGGGIKVDGGTKEEPSYTHTHGIHIRNNRITRCGNRYFSACGVLIKQAYECVVAHNEISYLYYTGISCGWTWRYEPSVNRDNLIEKNHVHHIGLGKLSDMGAIYLLSEQPGTIVRGNLVHDVESKHYGGWGIYPDEGSSFMLIENNICYNLTSNCIHNHYGRHNTVRNNIFVKTGGSPFALGRGEETHTSDYVTNNILVSDGTSWFSINRVFDENDKLYPKIINQNIISHNNLLFDVSGKEQNFLSYAYEEFLTHYTFEQAQNELDFDTGSVFADPLFVDYENNDFTLRPESPAFKLGFKQIDMSDVGIVEEK